VAAPAVTEPATSSSVILSHSKNSSGIEGLNGDDADVVGGDAPPAETLDPA